LLAEDKNHEEEDILVRWKKNSAAKIIKTKVIMKIKMVKIMISKRGLLILTRNFNSIITTWIKDSSSNHGKIKSITC
jgi:hypothetical protein